MNDVQPTKSKWLNQKKKKTIIFPLISFQNLRCDIFNDDFSPSEGHSVAFFLLFRDMVAMKAEKKKK